MQMNQIGYNKKGVEEPEKNNGIGMVWMKYFPYWPLFLLLSVLTLSGAWWFLRNRVPLYESTAAILIKDEKKGPDDSKMIESMNQLTTKKIIENEIEVIHSRALMNEVVKNLHLYAPVFENGNAKRPTSAYATSPIIVEAKNPDSVALADKVFFSFDKTKAQVGINGQSYPLNTWVETKFGTLKFIPQVATATPVEPLYFALISPKKVTQELIERLAIIPASKLSTVIDLSIQDDVAKRSEDILNSLLTAYNKAAVKDKSNLASSTLEFLDERLSIVGADLTAIESKMQQYKSTKGAVDISSQGQLFLQNVSTNDQKLGDVDMQLAVLNKVENYVKSKDNTAGIVPSTVGITDPLLSTLLDKLYTTELEYEKMKQNTGLNNPLLVSVNDQINKIKPSILENISNLRQNLEATKNNLNSTNNRYSSQLQNIPSQERDLVEISREQNTKRNIYDFLLQKREETALANTAAVADSRVIDKAESTGPINSDTKKIYIVAVILAIGLGIGLISLKELVNRTILFRHEIESRTSSPIIGEILHEKSKASLVLGDGQRTFVAEQFRKLRTSLAYIGIHGDRKKLLVTSTVPGDGKSFIVANLGLSLAMAGKRVVVLEFDLSDPTLSDKLGIITNKGLSDYLVGKAEVKDILRQTDVHENLFIIPSGPLPDNPSDLIVSNRVGELMDHITPLFDYVIVDTAPVGLLSDAYVLSSYCDGTLYVIRHRHTPKLAIERIDENNEINELKNMGIVFNDVRSRGFGNNGYGYGYGYGYIHKERKTKRKRKEKKNVA
jgi:tyrosine-protein kinase Etk/Wzc